jgi:SAM-dependent methyltransferase
MRPGVGNPFESDLAGRRYATGRLDVHAEFVRRIGWGLGGRRPRRALDIGCGTGLATRPLAAACGFAVGIDISAPMLAEAMRRAPLRLVRGRGERLPFSEASFDLLTMGSAFHWCEPGPLRSEIRRVLAPGGHLAVFDHFLAGRMEDDPGFAVWFEGYRERFAAPPRHPAFDASREEGFVPVARERFEHPVPLSLDALTAYVTSQSNVLAAVDAGHIAIEEAEAEMRAGLRPFFGRKTASVTYRGELDLLRKR